jgi:hypothetical protein
LVNTQERCDIVIGSHSLSSGEMVNT